MEIHVKNTQSLLPISEDAVRQIVLSCLSREAILCDEVSIHFVEASEISKLHQEHFQDSSVTDCISFPIDNSQDSGYKPLGDVFVCPAVALSYARTHSKTNIYRELTLYIIHGLLHLIGYDDLEKADRKTMRLAERRHMLHLKRRGLILQIV
jgi:probable rRNA maturation factor